MYRLHACVTGQPSAVAIRGEMSNVVYTSESRDGKMSDRIDVMMDLSSVVFTTLKDAAKLSPIPFLSQAAGIAVSIIDVVKRTRYNKDGFKKLAEDSCELVFSIVSTHQDVRHPESIPVDLAENLEQLVYTLLIIQKFAQKGASQNMLKALIWAGLDARRIQDYREKLQQCMRVFGLKSAISLRNAVANLMAHQMVIRNELETSIGPYIRPADFSAAHHFLTLLTANLRKNANGSKPIADWETISYMGHLLRTNDYVALCQQIAWDIQDAENLIEFIIYLIDKGLLTGIDLDLANCRARRLLIKLGISIEVVPKSLYLNCKTLSLQNQLSISYAGSSDFYKGDLCGTVVALKRFRQCEVNKYLCREVLTWRTLSHKYVLPFMGIYVDASRSFLGLVSPFMSNGTLSDWRRICKPIGFDIEQCILEVAEGLHYLHQEGITHGDLRGTNVLLDHNLHVKIANYGLARHFDSTGTKSPTLSFHFAAPELFWYMEKDPHEETLRRTKKTDVYAFACLYYEIHFGCIPFATKNPFVIARTVKDGKRPEKLREPQLGNRAWNLISQCWDQDPAGRPCMAAVVFIMTSWSVQD